MHKNNQSLEKFNGDSIQTYWRHGASLNQIIKLKDQRIGVSLRFFARLVSVPITVLHPECSILSLFT